MGMEKPGWSPREVATAKEVPEEQVAYREQNRLKRLEKSALETFDLSLEEMNSVKDKTERTENNLKGILEANFHGVEIQVAKNIYKVEGEDVYVGTVDGVPVNQADAEDLYEHMRMVAKFRDSINRSEHNGSMYMVEQISKEYQDKVGHVVDKALGRKKAASSEDQ